LAEALQGRDRRGIENGDERMIEKWKKKAEQLVVGDTWIDLLDDMLVVVKKKTKGIIINIYIAEDPFSLL